MKTTTARLPEGKTKTTQDSKEKREASWHKWSRQVITYVSPDVWGTDWSERYYADQTIADLRRMPPRVLLDTPTLDYLVRDPGRLSHNALLILNDTETECLVSPASWWEWAEKVRTGQYALQGDFGSFLTKLTKYFELVGCPITPQTMNEFTRLQAVNQTIAVPLNGSGKVVQHQLNGENTYDLWLAAHALALNVPLLTPDLRFGAFKKAGLKTIW